MISLDRRITQVEERADAWKRPSKPISGLLLDLERVCVRIVNDPRSDVSHQKRAFEVLAEYDAKEAKWKTYAERPDYVSAVKANVAASRFHEVPFPTGVRWPHLVHNFLWWEAYPTRRAAA